MVTEEELLRRMQSQDPASDVQMSEGMIDRVIGSAQTARVRRRRWALPSVLGLAALTVGGIIAAPAGADVIQEYLAQTGQSGSRGTESDDSEWIDPTASDYVDYVMSRYPASLPLPVGVKTQEFAQRVALDLEEAALNAVQAESLNDETLFRQQESGIIAQYERRALCLWIGEWITAASAGEQDDEAIEKLDLRFWPTIAATFVDMDEFMTEARAIAEAGDARAFEQTAVRDLCTDEELQW